MSLKAAVKVKNLVRTRIPTRYGEFMLYYYSNNLDNKEHIALVKGEVTAAARVLVRVHSECFTGDVLGSRRCDCGEQLKLALSVIGKAECGVLIYLRQEGRGIGLLKKLQAYNLQDQGLDTVDANIQLGHLPDERDYRLAALILKDLNVRSVQLITNNPRKISELNDLGVKVENRVPIEILYHRDNEAYLKAKAERMDHLLSLAQATRLSEEMAFIQPLIDKLAIYRQGVKKTPFVTLSYAQSIDGSIAIHAAHSYSLSSRKSLVMTHMLRARHDALLVGVNTVITDDPQLTVRYSEGEDPQPVVLDSTLRIPLDARLLSASSKRPILITTDQAPEAKVKALTQKGARVLAVKKDTEGEVDLPSMLDLLYELNIKTLMVEGGATVINRFLKAQLVDYCIVTVVPKIIGGLKAVENLCRPQELPPLAIVDCQYQQLDSDLIVFGPLGHR